MTWRAPLHYVAGDVASLVHVTLAVGGGTQEEGQEGGRQGCQDMGEYM
jgi:hypothetical protein